MMAHPTVWFNPTTLFQSKLYESRRAHRNSLSCRIRPKRSLRRRLDIITSWTSSVWMIRAPKNEYVTQYCTLGSAAQPNVPNGQPGTPAHARKRASHCRRTYHGRRTPSRRQNVDVGRGRCIRVLSVSDGQLAVVGGAVLRFGAGMLALGISPRARLSPARVIGAIGIELCCAVWWG
jgi:hypothetical protein